MDRPDWEEAVKMPIGIIPSGSSNALSKCVDAIFPDVATLNIIKGATRPFDLFAVRYMNSPEKKTRYGFLEILWALVADIDLESDKIRWLGPTR